MSDDLISKLNERGLSTDGLFLIQQEEERPQETGFRLSSVNGKSLEQLTASYQKAGITQSDLQAAYTTISRTKDEKEQTFSHAQTQPNIDDFEGR